jgi:FkbM family methyltransferase
MLFNMNIFERLSLTIRHHPCLEKANWLWNRLRPLYHFVITVFASNGLQRTINGTDDIRVLSQFRQIGEVYEPQIWQHMMSQVRSGDTIVDVGAYIGLYTVALAKRVGVHGKVIAFEPDPESFLVLKSHVRLNKLQDRVELVPCTISLCDGEVDFFAGKSSYSTISKQSDNSTVKVNSVRIDTYFGDAKIDILKIDVEGFEEEVIQSSMGLLTDKARSPRLIYIEVHPYVWSKTNTTSNSLIKYLEQCGYQIRGVDGDKIEQITHYGEIVAVKNNTDEHVYNQSITSYGKP